MRPDGISIDKRDWEKINAGKITYAQMLATKYSKDLAYPNKKARAK